MKTIKVFFPVLMAALVAISFNSCSSDDPTDLIVGTWEYTGASADVQTVDGNISQEIKDFFDEVIEDIDVEIYTFNEDGTCITKSGGETIQGYYKIKGGMIYFAETKSGLDAADCESNSIVLNKNDLSISMEMHEDAMAFWGMELGTEFKKAVLNMNFKRK